MADKLKHMHWKKILLVGGILMVALVAGLCVQKPEGIEPTPLQPSEELKLYDFPEAFKDSTLIIVGDNASEIEMQAANEIADYLENETGNKPLIRKHSEISDEDKRNYNLIVVGTPETNSFLEEVYAMTNATRVTEEFPGEGKGVLEILPNPWDESKTMLLVEGWDAGGVDIIGQITFQTERIHLKQVYGPYEGKKSETGMIGLPNPSAVYCENLGYRYEIRTKSDGSQLGFCIFDGEECPAWDFFNGLCGEEYTYCSKTGGVLVKIKNAGYVAACVLPYGKICYEWSYFMGACK